MRTPAHTAQEVGIRQELERQVLFRESSALLERYNRLSQAQRDRFIGYLLGADVSPEVFREASKALTYAESINPEGDRPAEQEPPHKALGRIAREARGEL